MIALKELTQKMENLLNTSAREHGLNNSPFCLHTDTGDFKQPERDGNDITEYINGLMELISSDVTNTAGQGQERIRFGTMSCRLQIIVRLPEYTEDKIYNNITYAGSKTTVDLTRAIIDDVAQTNHAEEMTDADGTVYYVSTFINFANTGIRAQISELGDSITYGLYINYLFVENGVNTRHCVFSLDGNVIPFQTFSIPRIATSDNNVFADTLNGETEATQLQTSWSITFELPATKGNVFAEIIDYLLRGKPNTLHLLETHISRGGRQEIDRRAVFINNSVVNGQTITNLGCKVTFENARVNYFTNIIPETYAIYKANDEFNAKITGVGYAHIAYNITKKLFPSVISGAGFAIPCEKDDIIIATSDTFNAETLTHFEIIRG